MTLLKFKFAVTDDEGKYLTFDDECDSTFVQEFFHRIGLALSAVYGHGGPRALRITPITPGTSRNKIALIKAMRRISHAGLKQAKEASEASDGIIMIAESTELASLASRYIQHKTGNSVDIIPIDVREYANMVKVTTSAYNASGPVEVIEEQMRKCWEETGLVSSIAVADKLREVR